MKRSKTLVTLVAATATTLTLVSTAFAAPATSPISGLLTGTVSGQTAGKNCPTKNLLNQLLGNGGTTGAGQPTTGASLPSNLQSLLGQLGQANPASQPITPSATKCPKAQAAQQQLQQQLGNLGITLPGTGSAAPAATPAPSASVNPAPTVAPTTSSTPVSGSMSADESKMVNLVNQDRASNGLKPLTFDAGLRAGALAHSQDMAQNNYFSHTSPTQGDFSTRIRAAGVQHTAAGENIAEYPSVDSAETGFMNSPGHRANILGDYTRVGIGIVNKGGTYYITQWFAK